MRISEILAEAKAVKQRLDAKCWTGKHKEGTKIKGGVRVNNCVPNENVNEFAPSNGSNGSGRWYTDNQMTELVGDGWWEEMDISGASIGIPDGDLPKEYMMQQAQAWLDDQGYNVEVHNIRVNDDDCDWFITGDFYNPGFAKEGVAEGKITLSTDPNWYGATVDNYQATGPVVNIPAIQLVGFEPDDKMNQPKSKANVEKILAGLKQGAKLPPLLVRKYKNGYQVLDGHHRFWAYKLSGVKSIPCQIVPDEDIEEISKQGVSEDLDAQFDAIEEMVEAFAQHHGVDAEVIWEDFESVDDAELLDESAAWHRKAGKNKNGGLNKKGVASYRAEHPGSKLQTAVTTKPSKLKKGSKAAKRRKSFCARMSGVKGPMKKPNGKPTRKALALRKWNC